MKTINLEIRHNGLGERVYFVLSTVDTLALDPGQTIDYKEVQNYIYAKVHKVNIRVEKVRVAREDKGDPRGL